MGVGKGEASGEDSLEMLAFAAALPFAMVEMLSRGEGSIQSFGEEVCELPRPNRGSR